MDNGFTSQAQNELMLELEMVPIARAMIGQEVEEARKINPAWCLRQQSISAYNSLKTLSDDDLLPVFASLLQTDPYMQRAADNKDVPYSTQAIGERMKEGYIRRTEAYYIERLLKSTTDKQRFGWANAIKCLYREKSPDVYVVDMEHPSPPEDFLMTYGGVSYRPRGDIAVIKAKAKSGKTSFLTMETACMICPSGQVNGMSRAFIPGTETIRDPYKVLFFDTEQSHASSDFIYRRILQMAGLPTNQNPSNFRMVNLRRTDNENRIERFEEEIASGQWDIVILDGVRDLVLDINDPIETHKVMSKILQIVEDTKVAFICVIHENPSVESNKMRGHLGTELGNKAYEVQQVKNNKDTGIYTVTNTDRRSKTIPAYGFKFDDDDNLIQVEAEGATGPGPQSLTREEKQWNQFVKAFEDNLDLSHTQEEIIDKLLVLGMSETTIKRRVKTYKAMKWLTADEVEGVTRFGLSIEQKSKIKARMNGENEAPIIGPNDPIWTNDNNDTNTPPF